ncbi:MAG: TetR-like C-terminal domain-containing protein [Myxococcota bacterium]
MSTDTRERLIDAVETVLSEEGVAGLSLRRVARLAGVSHAAPGVLFGDRAGMLTAFATRGFEELGDRMQGALAEDLDGPGSLAAVGQAYVDFAFDRPAVFEILFRQDQLKAHDEAYMAAARGAFRPLATALHRCRADGAVSDEDAADVLLTAWALVHGLVMLWQSKHLAGRVQPADPRVLGRRVTALFTGLLAERAP